MKRFILFHGGILIINLVSLVDLILLLLSRNYHAIAPIFFIVIVNITYWISVRKYSTTQGQRNI